MMCPYCGRRYIPQKKLKRFEEIIKWTRRALEWISEDQTEEDWMESVRDAYIDCYDGIKFDHDAILAELEGEGA
jgi:hypothetical protein